jgi:enolase
MGVGARVRDAIVAVRARERFDARGVPTVEAEVRLEGGAVGRALAPAGTSTGRHEARELRDGGPRLRGLGVRRAVAVVAELLEPALRGRPAADQAGADAALVAADGTPDRGRAGANALVAVSLAVARAAAAAHGLPLWAWIAHLAGAEPTLPLPMVNVFSGGLHAEGGADLQDYLFVPVGAPDLPSALEAAAEVRAAGEAVLRRRGVQLRPGLEGGLGPAVPDDRAPLAWLAEAMGAAGLEPGRDGALAVDVAASRLLGSDGLYHLPREGRRLDAAAMAEEVRGWLDAFPLVSVEDPLGEDDWEGWRHLTAELGGRAQLLGDDLFATQAARLEEAIARGVANAALAKCNQVGTLSETLAFLARARQAGYARVVSARSGETEDDWLADLAVGTGAGQIKIGSLRGAERTGKYNRLLAIAEEMAPEAPYAGRAALAGGTG